VEAVKKETFFENPNKFSNQKFYKKIDKRPRGAPNSLKKLNICFNGMVCFVLSKENFDQIFLKCGMLFLKN